MKLELNLVSHSSGSLHKNKTPVNCYNISQPKKITADSPSASVDQIAINKAPLSHYKMLQTQHQQSLTEYMPWYNDSETSTSENENATPAQLCDKGQKKTHTDGNSTYDTINNSNGTANLNQHEAVKALLHESHKKPQNYRLEDKYNFLTSVAPLSIPETIFVVKTVLKTLTPEELSNKLNIETEILKEFQESEPRSHYEETMAQIIQVQAQENVFSMSTELLIKYNKTLDEDMIKQLICDKAFFGKKIEIKNKSKDCLRIENKEKGEAEILRPFLKNLDKKCLPPPPPSQASSQISIQDYTYEANNTRQKQAELKRQSLTKKLHTQFPSITSADKKQSKKMSKKF